MRWRKTTNWKSPKRCKSLHSEALSTAAIFFSDELDLLRSLARIYVCLQMEIDSGDGLTEDFLYEEVHPMEHTLKQAFAKPRAPGGKRGNKRLIKGAGENGEDS